MIWDCSYALPRIEVATQYNYRFITSFKTHINYSGDRI